MSELQHPSNWLRVRNLIEALERLRAGGGISQGSDHGRSTEGRDAVGMPRSAA